MYSHLSKVEVIEHLNAILPQLKVINMTIRESGLSLRTFSGAKHLNKSLGFIIENNGRRAKEQVVQFVLLKNSVDQSLIDRIFDVIDLNWFDSSIVDDLKVLCGECYIEPEYSGYFFNHPDKLSRKF